MRRQETEKIVFGALFIAIVFVATYFVQIPTTGISGGLIHLGNIAMFSIALKYGKRYGALAGGIGMALFDFFSAWYAWAPGTLIVRGIMGYVMGFLSQDSAGQGASIVKNGIAILVGSVVMLVGYFLFEAVILGVGFAAIGGVPGNLIQLSIGVISVILVPMLPNLPSKQDKQ